MGGKYHRTSVDAAKRLCRPTRPRGYIPDCFSVCTCRSNAARSLSSSLTDFLICRLYSLMRSAGVFCLPKSASTARNTKHIGNACRKSQTESEAQQKGVQSPV
eukprot:6201586-Pleurochrysis_carterae.AAC.2